MKAFLVLGFLSLSTGLMAKDLDYDQIEALATKTVVDYFLLCPDIVPVADDRGHPANLELGDPEERSLAQVRRDLGFRRSLLSKGRVGPGVTVTSVIVDLKNAYIKIDGTRNADRAFSLVFVYFENAQKQRIPALTFHAEGLEDTEDYLRLYDLEADFWQALPPSQTLPEFSTQPLVPYVGTGDESNVTWVAELPRYGTTIRFLSRKLSDYDDVSDAARDYQTEVADYALECAWNKALGRFDAPRAALAEKAMVPRGTPSAADYYALRRPMSTDARQERDLWNASQDNPKDYFVHRGQEGVGTGLRILGLYQGLPLVAEIRWDQDLSQLFLWLYHADSGLMEPANLVSFFNTIPYTDFYKASRKAEGANGERLRLRYSLGPQKPGILVELDTSHWAENLDPDFPLYFEWDNQKGAFVKFTEGREETP